MARYYRFQAQHLKTMSLKKIGIVFVLFFNIAALAQSKKRIEIMIEESISYCGGAAPTEEVLEPFKKRKPYAFKTVYVYKGDKCVDSLITDSAGWIKRKIKKGKYKIYLPYKHFKTVPYGIVAEYDMVCLQKEWSVPDGTLDVSWKGMVFVNKRIGHTFCPWQYNCLKERHIPPSAPKQN